VIFALTVMPAAARRYIRDGELFTDNAAAGIGL